MILCVRINAFALLILKKNSIAKEVLDIFEYDPETGNVTWKKHPKLKGKSAGTIRQDKGGLILQLTIKGKKYRYQGARVIWYLHTGEDPGDLCVDHINGDRNDNRFANLRLATHQQNCWNRRGTKGYWLNNNRYQVDIRINGVSVCKGRFKTEEEAAKFYEHNIASLKKEFAPKNQLIIDP